MKNLVVILWAILGSVLYAYLLRFEYDEVLYLLGFTFGAASQIIFQIMEDHHG